MEETTTPKPVSELTLTEANQEIEAAGGMRKKRIDHARSLVELLRSGKTTGAQAAEAAAKRTIDKARKAKLKATNINPMPQMTEEEITAMATTTKTRKAPKAKRAHKTSTHKARKPAKNGETKSIIPASFRSQYVRDPKIKTESGAATIHNGDPLARAMAGLTQADFAKIAKENGVQDRFSGWQESLNPGQCRLNLGNVLRGMARRGEDVTIQGKKVRVPKLAKNDDGE